MSKWQYVSNTFEVARTAVAVLVAVVEGVDLVASAVGSSQRRRERRKPSQPPPAARPQHGWRAFQHFQDEDWDDYFESTYEGR